MGRSNVKSVAERRLPEIQKFLLSLFNSADEIAHSDLVYTFFHPLLRDQQEANLEMSKVRGDAIFNKTFYLPIYRESGIKQKKFKVIL